MRGKQEISTEFSTASFPDVTRRRQKPNPALHLAYPRRWVQHEYLPQRATELPFEVLPTAVVRSELSSERHPWHSRGPSEVAIPVRQPGIDVDRQRGFEAPSKREGRSVPVFHGWPRRMPGSDKRLSARQLGLLTTPGSTKGASRSQHGTRCRATRPSLLRSHVYSIVDPNNRCI